MKNIVVIGIGYVGLPLMLALAKTKCKVFGYDINKDLINDLNKGKCHIKTWENRFKKELVSEKNAYFISELNEIKKIDTAIICVPTPLNKEGKADHSCVDHAVKSLSELKNKPSLIILESTVSPGYSRKVANKYFKENLSSFGGEVHFCFSPEREDPGNENFSNVEIPKILSGLTKNCLLKGFELYMTVFNHVIKASSMEVAELCKLHENTFRAVNISYVNQMRDYCSNLDINFNEVILLAKSKPFGFMDFYPGVGVGGHCIPVDPYFLLNGADDLNSEISIIRLAMKEIEMGPKKTYHWLVKNNILGKNLLLTGVAYKEGVSDMRSSPAISLFKLLKHKCNISFWDSEVKEFHVDGQKYVTLSDTDFKNFRGVVVIINEIGKQFVNKNKICAEFVLDARYRTLIK